MRALPGELRPDSHFPRQSPRLLWPGDWRYEEGADPSEGPALPIRGEEWSNLSAPLPLLSPRQPKPRCAFPRLVVVTLGGGGLDGPLLWRVEPSLPRSKARRFLRSNTAVANTPRTDGDCRLSSIQDMNWPGRGSFERHPGAGGGLLGPRVLPSWVTAQSSQAGGRPLKRCAPLRREATCGSFPTWLKRPGGLSAALEHWRGELTGSPPPPPAKK